jgi:hypothetical protein
LGTSTNGDIYLTIFHHLAFLNNEYGLSDPKAAKSAKWGVSQVMRAELTVTSLEKEYKSAKFDIYQTVAQGSGVPWIEQLKQPVWFSYDGKLLYYITLTDSKNQKSEALSIVTVDLASLTAISTIPRAQNAIQLDNHRRFFVGSSWEGPSQSKDSKPPELEKLLQENGFLNMAHCICEANSPDRVHWLVSKSGQQTFYANLEKKTVQQIVTKAGSNLTHHFLPAQSV